MRKAITRSLTIMSAVALFPYLAAQAAGNAAAGAGMASSKCAVCHGAQGEGKDKNPALAGKDAAFLAKEMQNYRSGARQNPMMNMIAKPLSDEDIANFAAYYASLKEK